MLRSESIRPLSESETAQPRRHKNIHELKNRTARARETDMALMEKLKIFVVQEPVVAASCLIAGFGLFLPAVVRPILDSYKASEQAPQPALSDVVAGMTGKK